MNASDLQTTKLDLLKELTLTSIPVDKRPEDLRELDEEFLFQRLHPYGFGSEQNRFHAADYIESLVQRTDKGLDTLLDSDTDLLGRVKETGNDQEHQSLFLTVEGVFPVKLRGHVIGLVWTGKLPIQDADQAAVARAADALGVKPEDVTTALAETTRFTERQVEGLFHNYRQVRDNLQESLIHHLQLSNINRQLLDSERARSLGTLSSGIAHHFNNLLSVILGYSSHVLKQEDLAEDAHNAIRQITLAAQQGRRLTEEILAFSGSDVEEPERCDVHDTLTSVLSLLQSQTDSRIRIQSQFEADSDTVFSYPSVIRQVVFNLLASAIDGMPDGGLLKAATTNDKLETASGDKTCLRIDVTDSGAPLRDESLSTTEDLPLEIDPDDKRTSLYGMVGRMQGRVTVASDAGGVTCTRVWLPLAEEIDDESSVQIRRNLAPSHIWVVDDDPLFRQMCHQVLSENGHDVNELTSGSDLMKRWEQEDGKPELLVIDFSMPDYNGLELCEWLKEQGSRQPVLLISGFAPNHPDIKKALKIQNTYFLQKPFSVPELTDIATVALGDALI